MKPFHGEHTGSEDISIPGVSKHVARHIAAIRPLRAVGDVDAADESFKGTPEDALTGGAAAGYGKPSVYIHRDDTPDTTSTYRQLTTWEA